jgi:hypothetical protein
MFARVPTRNFYAATVPLQRTGFALSSPSFAMYTPQRSFNIAKRTTGKEIAKVGTAHYRTAHFCLILE